MKRSLSLSATLLTAATALALAAPSVGFAQGQSEAALPSGSTSYIAPLRIIPVVGTASFGTSSNIDLGNFGHGFAAGAYADFGTGALNLETGVISLNTTSTAVGSDTRSFSVNSWGIPILAKFNFGNPHHSFFVKAGGMPFTASGSTSDFNVMGVAGVGTHIPLGLNSSILLEGTYNRLFNNSGNLTNYQGVALMGGLSLNI